MPNFLISSFLRTVYWAGRAPSFQAENVLSSGFRRGGPSRLLPPRPPASQFISLKIIFLQRTQRSPPGYRGQPKVPIFTQTRPFFPRPPRAQIAPYRPPTHRPAIRWPILAHLQLPYFHRERPRRKRIRPRLLSQQFQVTDTPWILGRLASPDGHAHNRLIEPAKGRFVAPRLQRRAGCHGLFQRQVEYEPLLGLAGSTTWRVMLEKEGAKGLSDDEMTSESADVGRMIQEKTAADSPGLVGS